MATKYWSEVKTIRKILWGVGPQPTLWSGNSRGWQWFKLKSQLCGGGKNIFWNQAFTE